MSQLVKLGKNGNTLFICGMHQLIITCGCTQYDSASYMPALIM